MQEDARLQTPDARRAVFRRAIRVHPRRGRPCGWTTLDPVPWHADGFFTGDGDDPGGFLDYHTGCVYPQDAASQVPVRLLAPQTGETIIDTCAAPGSKSTQIGLALGDDGLVVCCDAATPRRRVLIENAARQGVACAVITPMPLEALAIKHPRCADAVLVDAPCSGHEERSPKQVARMALRQGGILAQAATLVRPGGRLVYSTCTAYRDENEGVITGFLARHPGWLVVPSTLPACDADQEGLGALRLSPERQGTEPFFACLLRAPGDAAISGSLTGRAPDPSSVLQPWLPSSPLTAWRRGNAWFAATPQAACCALPSEARGILLGHGDELKLEPWAAQALIERGAAAATITHADACRLWAGEPWADGDGMALVKTDHGAPLGLASGGRLQMPSRLHRAGLR